MEIDGIPSMAFCCIFVDWQQGTDPATDFRGMGLLGLVNLVYFAEEHGDTFRKIVNEQAERKERDYPVAVAGINVTQMLFDLFQIGNNGTS